ncbi:MAG: hypothetical protein ACJA1F_003379 [Paracoccaceae bacterium]|jgi:hypothetical protein
MHGNFPHGHKFFPVVNYKRAGKCTTAQSGLMIEKPDDPALVRAAPQAPHFCRSASRQTVTLKTSHGKVQTPSATTACPPGAGVAAAIVVGQEGQVAAVPPLCAEVSGNVHCPKTVSKCRLHSPQQPPSGRMPTSKFEKHSETAL